DKDVIVTSPSLGVAEFNESAENAFNIWPHDSVGTKGLASFAINRGWTKAGVFSNQNPWESAQAKVFRDEFARLGGTIVAAVEPLAEMKDLRTEALQIVSAKPDVVFMSNYTQMDVAAKDLRRLGYSGEKMAILMDNTRLENSEGALDGTIYAIYPDGGTNFAERYMTRFGESPGIAADTGYDAVHLYARAVEAAGSFRVEEVRRRLESIRHSGASGEIVFDGKRGVVKEPVFWSVKNSQRVPLDMESTPNI
ncbi:MAG: ABC transporter substrate-binding protein, partial [Deltaproteobacteria bacterium]|nr:ABC transporter substrate-binding protein [Deltaproteobacteria bacterium]